MYVKFLPKYLVENKYSMLAIIIIIIIVLNISTKITCGGCLFYMHIVPWRVQNTLCELHIYKRSVQGNDDFLFANCISSYSNVLIHSSFLKSLREMTLGLSNQFPITYCCSTKFLFLINKFFTTQKTLRGSPPFD